MKKVISVILVLMSVSSFAEVTYNSNGTWSQSVDNGYGGYTTYNSDGTYS